MLTWVMICEQIELLRVYSLNILFVEFFINFVFDSIEASIEEAFKM